MGILPEFRGQGLGQRMLEHCIALARQAGVTLFIAMLELNNLRH